MKALLAALFVLSFALTGVRAEDVISTNEEVVVVENEDIVTKNVLTEVEELEVTEVEVSE